ncbi:MAG: ATP-dependent DNA helicase RecG [Patescibacteria group bacterium]
MATLSSHISSLSRVGKTTNLRFRKLGLETIQDLIFYFPWRYDNFGQAVPIEDVTENSTVNIIGEVNLIHNRRSFRRKMSVTEALIKDDTETIKVIWFNQPFISKTLHVGDIVSLAGKATLRDGQLILLSPTYEKISSEEQSLIHTQGLTPIYSTTANLTQKQIRTLIKQNIDLTKNIIDWIPKNIKQKLKLIDLDQALYQIHFPKSEDKLREAKQRLGFSELFLRQLQSQITKKELMTNEATPIAFQENITRDFVASLPFKITDDQKRAAWEILQDLQKETPMSRLLEGDVGSGKTLVAIIALLNTAKNDQQAILMAPTEILAEQHFANISRLLQKENITIGIITSTNKKISFGMEEKGKLKSQEIINRSQILIGTHALIQKNLKFPKLSLVIVDEQHRFGVEQRQKLLLDNTDKKIPHFLSMTATPIPRSLALAIYGDLDVSIIKEKPQNRQEIITEIVSEKNREKTYNFIAQEIKNGRQAFVICPLIDPSDKLGVKSVKEEHQKLDQEIFPEISVGLLHGQMKGKDKEKIMRDFLDNKIQILVATSVIEVGIDVPNASIMIIEGADRFGLAQLHQFRGRVGRDRYQSYCFLFPKADEDQQNKKSLKRLEALVKHQDGFLLAKEDLKLRGAGEIYGLIQSGYPEIKIASLFDYELIKQAQDEAELLIAQDPELNQYPLIKEKLGDFNKQVHLE